MKLQKIRGPRQVNANLTRDQFSESISILEEGIQTLIEGIAILVPEGESTDRNTPEGASKFAVWRFISTLPISLTWCFDIAICGDYLISKNILRLCLEETIKLAYYSSFPESALRQMVQSRNSDDISIADMLKQLKLEQKNDLLKLHGNISNFYSHANLNLPPELIYEEGGRYSLGGGSRYLPDKFEAIVYQLIILLGNAYKYLLLRFPILIENDAWIRKWESFMLKGNEILSNRKSNKDE